MPLDGISSLAHGGVADETRNINYHSVVAECWQIATTGEREDSEILETSPPALMAVIVPGAISGYERGSAEGGG